MTTTNQEIKALKQEIKQLASLMQDSVREVSNGHDWHIDTNGIRRSAHRAGENVRSFVDAQSKHAAVLRDQAEESIATHPFRSVALGMAGGLILGALLRRR